MYPVPPRSVAEISRITTNRATDLIAVVKGYQKERTNKNGQEILDVTLIDDSETVPGKLATIVVSLWGPTKIAQVKNKKREAMVFFNLSVSCSDGKPQINHYADERAENAPPCEKTDALDGKKDVLTSATNTEQLTDVWAPQHTVRDVSGPNHCHVQHFWILHQKPRKQTCLPSCSSAGCISKNQNLILTL